MLRPALFSQKTRREPYFGRHSGVTFGLAIVLALLVAGCNDLSQTGNSSPSDVDCLGAACGGSTGQGSNSANTVGANGDGVAEDHLPGDLGDSPEARRVSSNDSADLDHGSDAEFGDGVDGCLPTCSVGRCGQGDGCGGACGPCGVHESCTNCDLSLRVVSSRRLQAPSLTEVIVAVDYHPSDENELPALADFRLRMSGPVSLKGIAVSPELVELGKELFIDPDLGRPFRILQSGVAQVLLYSRSSNRRMSPGRWLFFRLWISSDDVPAVIGLQRREGTLAPAAADWALWGSVASDGAENGSSGQLVIWSDGYHEAGDAGR